MSDVARQRRTARTQRVIFFFSSEGAQAPPRLGRTRSHPDTASRLAHGARSPAMTGTMELRASVETAPRLREATELAVENRRLSKPAARLDPPPLQLCPPPHAPPPPPAPMLARRAASSSRSGPSFPGRGRPAAGAVLLLGERHTDHPALALLAVMGPAGLGRRPRAPLGIAVRAIAGFLPRLHGA